MPFASLKSASETKGGDQSSPWFSPLSPRCILINRFPWCYNPTSLLSILILPKGNQDLSILPNDNMAFFSPKVSRLWWDGLSNLMYLSSFQFFIWVTHYNKHLELLNDEISFNQASRWCPFTPLPTLSCRIFLRLNARTRKICMFGGFSAWTLL
jgi:hypothetical protein